MSGGFEEKVAVITGAAHGIGRGIALALVGRGAVVHAVDIDADRLAETARRGGSACHAMLCDLGRRAAVQQALTGIEADILVNCAGGVCGQTGRPIEEISAEDWQAILDANLSSSFFVTQALVPAMKRKGAGRIVNISSGAGRGVSLTGIQAYASAKAGQIGLTRQLAHELGVFGITVNCIAPGFVRSNPATEKQWEDMGEDGQKALLQRIAMRRLGTVEDIVHAVLFLTSEEAGWISGETLGVDGGK